MISNLIEVLTYQLLNDGIVIMPPLTPAQKIYAVYLPLHMISLLKSLDELAPQVVQFVRKPFSAILCTLNVTEC